MPMPDEVQEIVDKFIFDIRSGVYEPEDKLPSENELSEAFKVPRMTARQAYATLQERGYVYSIQGKGNYVKNRMREIPLVLSGSVSFSRKMTELGYDYESRNVFCEEVPFSYHKKIYQALEADERDRVFRIGRLRLIEGRPIALHVSYVAESLFADIAEAGRQITSIYDYYRGKGYAELEAQTTVLSVVFPSKQEKDLLECSGLIPLLVLESGRRDRRTGKVLEHTKTLYRSDSFTYVIKDIP